MLKLIYLALFGLECFVQSTAAQRIDVGTTLSTEYILNTIWDSTTQTQTMVNSAVLTSTHSVPTVTESFMKITTKSVPTPFPMTLTASTIIPTTIPSTVTFLSSQSVLEVSTKLVPFPVTLSETTSILKTATEFIAVTSTQNQTLTATATIDHTKRQTDTEVQTEVQFQTQLSTPTEWETDSQKQTLTESTTLTKTVPCPHQSSTFVSVVTVMDPTTEIQTQSAFLTMTSHETLSPQTISFTNPPFTSTLNEFTTIDAATSILTSLFVTQVPSSINIYPTATLTEGGSVDSTSTVATPTATPSLSCNSSFSVASTNKHYYLGTRSSRHCRMTEIESSLESAQVSEKICAPVFVKSWETNSYNGTCLTLQPGGAGAIVPPVGGCDASLYVLCN